MNMLKLYYLLRPIIPRSIQIFLRSVLTMGKRPFYRDVWPIDPASANPPPNWPGWPGKKRFALVLTHDVDTMRGQQKCMDLFKMDQQLGFRSSFNFVPERYPVWLHLQRYLIQNGSEVGVHGLCHDGKLFLSKAIFDQRAVRINHYLRAWGAKGFSSPAMHHNLEWMKELEITYDISTFDTDPFEPQPDGVGTIFPFWVNGRPNSSGFIELPYTLPQDFTLFVLMREKNIAIWKQKLDWIAEKGGMALLNTHPDYLNFGTTRRKMDEYPADYYQEFLLYIKKAYHGQYWNVLPKDLASFWIKRLVEARPKNLVKLI